jgi:hypothetical protein
VVPHALPVRRIWLVGRNVEALVNLARIGDDDLPSKVLRKLEGKL